jgi:NDP-sugar pyrophosphorylase family protein
VSFPIQEYWLDIGQKMDYAKAQADAQEGKLALG